MNKTLYIIRGLVGAGKTSLAKLLSANCVCADDFPAFNEGGTYKYILERQKESHEWCFKQVETMMNEGLETIAVHNTFASLYYLQPYINLANNYGYSAQVIHTEGIILPNGEFTQSTHNVPQDITQKMRDSWEPLRPPALKGISTQEIAQELSNLRSPEIIVADMDKTVKFTKTGKDFLQTPDDVELNPQFLELLKLPNKPSIFIVSNQRGIAGGQKTVEFLKAEFQCLLGLLTNAGIAIDGARFAIDKKYALVWEDGELVKREMPERADKPGVGMAADILHNQSEHGWMVGDSHNIKFDDDWQLVLNCRQKLNVDLKYIPIEFLGIAVNSCL